jgi:hypothetical protein
LSLSLGIGFAVPGVLWLILNARWKPSTRLEPVAETTSSQEEMLEGRVG